MVSVAKKLGACFRCNVIDFTVKRTATDKGFSDITIIKEIADLKKELVAARCHFDHQLNFDLIDADIYNINALEARYNYLIKMAKKNKVEAFSII